MPQTKAEREEGKLWHLLYLQKRVGIPDEVWKDLRSYGAPQPIDSGEALIDDLKAFVKEFRRLPQRSHPDKKEAALANKLRKGKVQKCSKPHCRNDAASPRAKFCLGCFKDNARCTGARSTGGGNSGAKGVIGNSGNSSAKGVIGNSGNSSAKGLMGNSGNTSPLLKLMH